MFVIIFVKSAAINPQGSAMDGTHLTEWRPTGTAAQIRGAGILREMRKPQLFDDIHPGLTFRALVARPVRGPVPDDEA
jgi:hypothetical protein